MQVEQDTIVAISTPPGRGGIGMVRLSGVEARAIAAGVCRLRGEMAAGRARFAEVVDEAGAVLDEAVVTLFAGPRSYTGEDVVEISVHGSPVLLEWVLRECVRRGARLAGPGEFTQRAFLAGRLDLTQAEAVNDLIAAQTLHQARVAAAQLGGAVAREVAPVKEALIGLIAELEAGVDFAEDDLDLLAEAEIGRRIEGVREPLARLEASYGYGRVVREGFTLAIVGRPNAGKSSLFNRLLGRERAIVTAEAGTTRDAVSERLSMEGIPVEVIDTAGLREAESEAERLGVARTRDVLAEADVVLMVVDSTTVVDGIHEEDEATLAGLVGRRHLVVLNKCDLVRVGMAGVAVSAATGEGLEELRREVLGLVTQASGAGEGAMLTNVRQHEAVTAALRGITAAGAAARGGLPHELILLDLYGGLEALDRLTGSTTQEDILETIFSSFCIGK